MNDLLLFAETTREQMSLVIESLKKFCMESGQRVITLKTKIFFSHNVSSQLVSALSSSYGFRITHDLGRYLGVPLLHGKVTKETYRYVMEKVQAKLKGWKADRLSMV